MGMGQPRIKRYALIPQSGDNGVRRFSLARVTGAVPDAERLERMEEIAALDRREDGHPPQREGPGR
jgi:hypothetical protein